MPSSGSIWVNLLVLRIYNFQLFALSWIEVLSSTKVDLQMLESKLCSFPAKSSFYRDCLPSFQKFEIVLSYVKLDIQLLENKFCSFPDIPSIEVIMFHGSCLPFFLNVNIILSSTKVDLQMLKSRFAHF